MSDSLARAEPVTEAPFDVQGFALALAPPMSRYSLRARDLGALEAMLGVNVPAKIGQFEGEVACFGPDEWLLRSLTQRKLIPPAGIPMSIVDVSERSICLIAEGARASAVLNSGCPLDLARFASGRATRTIFETVEIILFREAEARFQVEVWRSFAPWLWAALKAAATG